MDGDVSWVAVVGAVLCVLALVWMGGLRGAYEDEILLEIKERHC